MSTVAAAPATDADDYDVIYATVMESARGRWFLQEYAQRARHADTTQVLAAIARIEGVIRERSSEAYQSFRTELLEMARAIAETRIDAAATTDEPRDSLDRPADAKADRPARDANDNFATAERIKDVAWTMRERGFDPATCDQIEQLASSILSAAALRNPDDDRAQKLAGVLGYLERRIDAMLASVAASRLFRIRRPPSPALARIVPSRISSPRFTGQTHRTTVPNLIARRQRQQDQRPLKLLQCSMSTRRRKRQRRLRRTRATTQRRSPWSRWARSLNPS